jgi:hypothetical protein
MYEKNERAKEQFESWKSQRFSEYDRVKHDDFISQRYQEAKMKSEETYESTTHFTP